MMQPVTDAEGNRGFYDESIGFIGLDVMQKVTSPEGVRGYYNEQVGFIPAPQETSIPVTTPESPAEPPGLMSRVGSKLGEAFSEATNPEYSMSRKAVRSLGTLGEAAGDVMMEGAKGAFGLLTTPTTRETLGMAGKYIANTDVGKSVDQTVGDLGRAWRGVKLVAPETATDIEKGIAIPNLVPAAAGVRAAAPVLKEGALITADAARLATPKLVQGLGAVKQTLKPSLAPDEALGHVLQGKTKDLAKGRTAIKAIDVKGVKTYQELAQRLDDAIPEYARKVDAELMKDMTPRKLDQLSTVETTQGGKPVTSNYVKTALDNLNELYQKTAQPVKAGEIDELLKKADTTGLTKKEVNDIARVYGSEFTAFNPMTGTPPTTVTKQLYENVRKGLKEVARRGLSDEAKDLDAIMSSLFNTRRLIEKNVEAYNRINQKTTPRGIIERAGGAVTTALDIATGGFVKGAVSKLIPRNAGYKLQNYLDLEKNLEKNLRIVTKEIERQEKGAFQPWSQTGKAIEKRGAAMEEALGVLTSQGPQPAVKLVQAGPKGGDIPKLQRELSTIGEKIATMEAAAPVPNIIGIQKALKERGVPFMKQLNESKQGFEDRVVQQYQRSIGPEVPTVPGREPQGLKALRDRQEKLQEALGVKILTTPEKVDTIASPSIKVTPDEWIRDKVATLEAAGLNRERIERALILSRGSLVSEARRKGIVPASGPEEIQLKALDALIESVTGNPVKNPPKINSKKALDLWTAYFPESDNVTLVNPTTIKGGLK